MSKKSGLLFEDKYFYYYALHTEQRKEFGSKILCHKLDKIDFNPVLDEKGKPIIILKEKWTLKQVGFGD